MATKYRSCSVQERGPKDVASFALVVSYWAMDKNRATIILDEDFRNVSPDLQANVGDMLRMISDKLKLQFDHGITC